MDIIYVPLGWLLKWCSNLVGNNYIVAILIIALVFEILLLPFAIKQQKNSIKQARLRPKEAAIRKKYSGRDDKPTQQKMTQEIQELYQKEGYNPMSGCLPLLIQFPLLIGLWGVITDPLKYICGLSDSAINQIKIILGDSALNSTGTVSLLTEITSRDYSLFANVEGFTPEVYASIPNLSVFGLDLAISPKMCMNLEAIKTVSGWLILLVPVLTFLSYFFSMKISRKFSYQPMNDAQQAQMGCSNKMMDIMMPLFSVFISFGVPAALGVYWIFKSLLGIVKQIALYYAMPLPKFTEEDYKQAEKEIGAQTEKNSKVKKSGRVVRSLHHIDDEDFEDTAEAARRHKEALQKQEEEDRKAQEATGLKGLFSMAGLKKDEKDKKSKKDKKDSEVKNGDTDGSNGGDEVQH